MRHLNARQGSNIVFLGKGDMRMTLKCILSNKNSKLHYKGILPWGSASVKKIVEIVDSLKIEVRNGSYQNLNFKVLDSLLLKSV